MSGIVCKVGQTNKQKEKKNRLYHFIIKFFQIDVLFDLQLYYFSNENINNEKRLVFSKHCINIDFFM